jgi:hypothetical protein
MPTCTWRGGKDSPSSHLLGPARHGIADWPDTGYGASHEAALLLRGLGDRA